MKTLLAFLVVVCAALAIVYRSEALALLASLEMLRDTMPLTVALILIGLEAISGPIGFPGTPLTLLAGSLFGPVLGTVVALLGHTLGAIFAFLLARYVAGEYVERTLRPRYPRLSHYETRLEQKPFVTVFALRLIPLVPFNALNFILGLTRVPLRSYALATLLGMIPGTFAYVYLGGSLRMLSPLNIALALLGIIALIYIGNYYEKRF